MTTVPIRLPRIIAGDSVVLSDAGVLVDVSIKLVADLCSLSECFRHDPLRRCVLEMTVLRDANARCCFLLLCNMSRCLHLQAGTEVTG